MVSLDIGCGHNPKGTVNIDLFLESTEQRGTIDYKLNPRNIRNFILGDAQFLPFRNRCFKRVYSNQVIEHVKNPFFMLKEIIRVARKRARIKIICPHRFSLNFKRNSTHINALNLRWFTQALTILKIENFEMGYSNHFFIPFFSQCDIIIKMRT